MQCNLERNACIVHTFTHTYTCAPCQVPESERALDSTLAHRTLVSDTCILRRDARTSPTRVGHSGPHGASDEHNKNTATPLGKWLFVVSCIVAHFGEGNGRLCAQFPTRRRPRREHRCVRCPVFGIALHTRPESPYLETFVRDRCAKGINNKMV